MLQMASVYGLQMTAKHAPVFFLPRVAEVSSTLLLRNKTEYLKNPYPSVRRKMLPSSDNHGGVAQDDSPCSVGVVV